MKHRLIEIFFPVFPATRSIPLLYSGNVFADRSLMKVIGVVLAGGRSSRFGGDKRFARLEGETLLQRAVRHMQAVTPEVWVLVEPGFTLHLPGCILFHDPEPHRGPAVALAALIEHLIHGGPREVSPETSRGGEVEALLIAPVDMPYLNEEVLAFLRDRGTEHPGVLWTLDARHPLPLFLPRTHFASWVEAVEQGAESLRACLDRLPHRVAPQPFEPDVFHNVNRREDLAS